MKAGRIALIALAAAAVGLSAFNASWIAPKPQGRLDLIARAGVALPVEAPADGAPCSARLLEEPGTIIENTLFALRNAITMGAQGFALDVHATRDGRAVVFRDPVLDCRTEGTGPVAERTLAELKTLDVGHGYSVDDGEFPLRGRGVGGILTIEDVLRAYPAAPLLLILHSPDAADAALAEFERAGVEIGDPHGFAGDEAALARLRGRTERGWTLDRAAAEACYDAYFATGWIGIVPEECEGRMLSFAIGERSGWSVWGWPYRFLDRIADAESRMLILKEWKRDIPVGLTEPEELGEVPRGYKGLLLVEDMAGVGRALKR